MKITINYNGRSVSVEVSAEFYEYLDQADHKAENLAHEQRRHWDDREYDEYIIATEGRLPYCTSPEERAERDRLAAALWEALACAGQYPGECRQTDADPETGCMEFDIANGRFSFHLTAPYREECREAARQYARENNVADRLKQCGLVHTLVLYFS